MNIAIITARGGSKRIPKKNIRDFCGKPIIAFSISAAIESKLFSEVMVSTDSTEIAEIAVKCGASVPFLRSSENANDFAGTADVIAEVLSSYERTNKIFKQGCCIYPTAPLLSPSVLTAGLELFEKNNFDVVFPVLKYGYPIQRSLKMGVRNQVSMIWPENYSKRSQDLEPVFHDAGQFYWFRSEYILKHKKLFGDNIGGLLIDEMSAQDIDSESDWLLAELKYRSLGRNRSKKF